MKRVKIMLSSVLVVAIVAGTLAFKVKKTQLRCAYTHTTTTNCPFWKKTFLITVSEGSPGLYGTTLVEPASGVCPTRVSVCTAKVTPEE